MWIYAGQIIRCISSHIFISDSETSITAASSWLPLWCNSPCCHLTAATGPCWRWEPTYWGAGNIFMFIFSTVYFFPFGSKAQTRMPRKTYKGGKGRGRKLPNRVNKTKLPQLLGFHILDRVHDCSCIMYIRVSYLKPLHLGLWVPINIYWCLISLGLL